MLHFLDTSIRDGAAMRHALLTANGASAAAAKRVLDAAVARGAPEVHKFALQVLIQDAIATRYWATTAAENSRLVLLKEQITAALAAPGRIGLFADAFEAVDISETLLNEFFTNEKLHLSPADVLTITIALNYATNDGTRSTGKKLLQRRVASVDSEASAEAFVTSIGDDQVVRSLSVLTVNDLQYAQFNRALAAYTNAHGPTITVPSHDAVARVDCHVPLATFIDELGPVCIATPEDATETLAIYPWPVTAKDVAGTLGMFMSVTPPRHDSGSWSSVKTSMGPSGARKSAPAQSPPQWNHMAFVEAVVAENATLDWTTVLEELDTPMCKIDAGLRFNTVLASYRKATGNAAPIHSFLKPWTAAPASQLQILRFYAANPDLFDRSGLPVVPSNLVPSAVASADFSAAWHSPSFTAALLDCAAVAGPAMEGQVTALILAAARVAPAAVTAALVTANTRRSLRLTKIVSDVLQGVGVTQCFTQEAVDYITKHNRGQLMLRLLAAFIGVDHGRAASVLPVLQAGRLFPRILAVASDPIVHVLLAITGQECGHVPTHYLSDSMQSGAHGKDKPVSRVALAMAAVDVCDDLVSKGSTVSVAIRTALTAVANSGLGPVIPGVVAHARSLLSAANAFGVEPVQQDDEGAAEEFAKEVEDVASRVVEEACKRFPEPKQIDPSTNPDAERCFALANGSTEERTLMRCIAKMVNEEAACVNQYPPSVLINFSRFFGHLILRDLMPPGELKAALRVVLQSVINPSDPRMRDFGVTALGMFKSRLVEWPAFRRSLRQAQDLDMYLPGIMAHITAADKQAAEAAEGAGAGDGAKAAADAPSGTDGILGLHQHDIRMLLSESKATAPSSVVQDRINFLVGNTDTDAEKTDTHARELRGLLRPEFYQHFAEYLVVKRIALEPNNHRTYLNLIERLESLDLEGKIRRATMIACNRLISSEKVCTNSSERSLLKSLGSWLGLITFAKNIPVLARDLDVRELVPTALKEGKLIAVVPFLAKLVEHSASSRAFRIPNPLIMTLLAQMAEMYHLDDLKITLRFEVEVLCRNLHVQIQDLLEFVKERPHHQSLHDLKAQFVNVQNSYDFRPSTEESDAPRTKLTANAAPYEPKADGPTGSSTTPSTQGSAASGSGIGSHHMMRQASGLPIASFLQLRELHPGREIVNIPAQHQAQYRSMLQHAFDSGLMETQSPLDRSATIACTTTREILAKDFARDRDDQALATSAHAMARGLATTLVNVTARDLAVGLVRKHLNQYLPRVFTPETVNDVIENLLSENQQGISQALEDATLELTAVKIDTELQRLFDERHQAWRTGEPAYPAENVSESTARALAALPPQLRPTSGLSQGHLGVYYSFLPARVDHTVEQVVQLLQTIEDAALRHYTECPPSANQAHMLSLTNVSFTETTQSEHHDLIKKKLVEVNQWISEQNAVPLLTNLFPRIMVLAEKVQAEQRQVQMTNTAMLHGNLLLNEVCLFVLQAIREKGQGKAVAELTRLYAMHEKRWVTKELAANLIRLRVIDIAEFDRVLTRALQETQRQAAVEFAGYIVQKCLIEDKLATVKDLKNTLEILEQIAEQSKKQRAPTRMRVPTMHNAPYRQEIEAYFDEWLKICDRKSSSGSSSQPGGSGTDSPPPQGAAPNADGQQGGNAQSKQVIALNFVKKLQDSGMLKADTMLDRFFGVLTELCVEDFATHVMNFERTLTPEQRAAQDRGPEITRGQVNPPDARLPVDPSMFQAVDAFSDLIVVLIKCCAWSTKRDDTRQQQGQAETALIQRVLHVVAASLQFNHDWAVDPKGVPAQYQQQPALPEGTALQSTHLQQPYMRLLSNLMIALAPTSTDDRNEFFMIMAATLHSLNPQRLPGFAFAWIELVGHRLFIGKLMKSPSGWEPYYKLVNDALRFVEPFARPREMTDALVLYFKCVLKLMLLLLHDFSEFLLAHHQPLCDAIPPCCIQLRNIVLSAFPRQTKLPDPFARNGRYSLLPELRDAPSLISKVQNPWENKQHRMPVTKAEFDAYITTKQPADFPRRLVAALTPSGTDSFDIPTISAVVLYAGIATIDKQAQIVKDAVAKAQAQNDANFDPDPLTFNESMGAAEILRTLLAAFPSEGRYHVVNACVNQLRFPNSHTHFFSLALQHLFAFQCPHQEQVQEHITRILVERLIISRPHPWGLLITFFDIVKEPRNAFWEKPFIRCTAEIERMFESVAQSVHPSQGQQAQVGAATGQPGALAPGASPSTAAVPGLPAAPGQPTSVARR